jgi:2-phosphosulfolactate phosphatase
MQGIFDQHEFEIRCEWALTGIEQLAPISDVFVVVDVLSFATCVDIAVSRGAVVYPYRWRDERAYDYAKDLNAVVAARGRGDAGYSLSPTSLLHIPAGTRLVLPSPNGATLSLATGDAPTFAGCLRNARAVAQAVQQIGARIAIIPAGERWPDGSLRPALEDLVGAGAIIHCLGGTRSPEAAAAETLFLRFKGELESCLKQCSSGKELIALGFAQDVALAAALNASTCAPRLADGAYHLYEVAS